MNTLYVVSFSHHHSPQVPVAILHPAMLTYARSGLPPALLTKARPTPLLVLVAILHPAMLTDEFVVYAYFPRRYLAGSEFLYDLRMLLNCGL